MGYKMVILQTNNKNRGDNMAHAQRRNFTRGVLLSGLGAALGASSATGQTVNTYTIVSLLDYSGPFANRGKPVEQMQRLLVD